MHNTMKDTVRNKEMINTSQPLSEITIKSKSSSHKRLKRRIKLRPIVENGGTATVLAQNTMNDYINVFRDKRHDHNVSHQMEQKEEEINKWQMKYSDLKRVHHDLQIKYNKLAKQKNALQNDVHDLWDENQILKIQLDGFEDSSSELQTNQKSIANETQQFKKEKYKYEIHIQLLKEEKRKLEAQYHKAERKMKCVFLISFIEDLMYWFITTGKRVITSSK
eukprot:6111_1